METQVAPLACRACGAPVPLPPGREGPCPYCGAVIPVPSEYFALREAAERARQVRQAAEQEWQKIPRPLPVWFTRFAAVAICVIAAALTTASLIGWVFYHVFSSPRDMLMLGVFTPMFLVILGLVETVSYRSYARHLEALSGLPPAEGRTHPRCRMCGAPLLLEPGALAATCDYCSADNVVTHLSARSSSRLAWERREAEQHLHKAVSAAWCRRSERRLARYVTVPVLVVIWLVLWFLFPTS